MIDRDTTNHVISKPIGVRSLRSCRTCARHSSSKTSLAADPRREIAALGACPHICMRLETAPSAAVLASVPERDYEEGQRDFWSAYFVPRPLEYSGPIYWREKPES